jgi:hypothetical protein
MILNMEYLENINKNELFVLVDLPVVVVVDVEVIEPLNDGYFLNQDLESI